PTGLVEDAYPLQYVHPEGNRVTIRVAELESETDELDYVGLSAYVGERADFGVTPDGRAVAYRLSNAQLRTARWTGRNEPYISPVAPGSAYKGENGDSLELEVESAYAVRGTPWRRGIGISLIPKPHAPRPPGTPIGVTIRVSPDVEEIGR